MDLDSKSDLEKRLEGMTPAQKMREFLFTLENIRRDITGINEKIAENTRKIEKSGGL